MKNLNKGSFFSESDDASNEDKTTSSSSASESPRPTLDMLFNQYSLQQAATERSHILNLFEAADVSSKVEIDSDTEDDDDAEAPASTPIATPARRISAIQSVGSLLRSRQLPRRETPQPTRHVESSETPQSTEIRESTEEQSSAAELPIVAETSPIAVADIERPNEESAHDPETLSPASETTLNEEPDTAFQQTGPPTPPLPPQPPVFARSPHPSLYNANTMLVPTQAASTPQFEQAPSTVIEQKDSSGSMLSFMSALYLNRRRKKQIKVLKKKIQDTEKQIDTTESSNKTQQQEQQRRTTALEQSRLKQNSTNQQVTANLENNVLTNSSPEQPPLQSVIEQAPEPTITIENEQTINQSPEQAAAIPIAIVAKKIIGKRSEQITPQAPAYERAPLKRHETNPTEAPPITAEINKRSVNEKIMSTRREAQDNKATAVFKGSPLKSTAQRQQPAYVPQATTFHSQANQTPASKNVSISIKKSADVYKQSMQTGFIIGLAVIVLGLIAYFLTS